MRLKIIAVSSCLTSCVVSIPNNNGRIAIQHTHLLLTPSSIAIHLCNPKTKFINKTRFVWFLNGICIIQRNNINSKNQCSWYWDTAIAPIGVWPHKWYSQGDCNFTFTATIQQARPRCISYICAIVSSYVLVCGMLVHMSFAEYNAIRSMRSRFALW